MDACDPREDALKQALIEAEDKLAQARAELCEARERLAHAQAFAKAFHAAPIPIGIIRLRDRRMVAVNDFFVARIGRPREELLGRTTAELGVYLNPDSRERIWQMIDSDRKLVSFEVDFKHEGGEPRTSLLSGEVMEFDGEPCIIGVVADITARKLAEPDASGPPIRMVGTLTDVTDLKDADKKLRESDALFRSLVHNLSDAIVLITPDGTVFGGTPSLERMLGHELTSLAGKSAFEFVHPDDIEIVQEAFAETVQRTNPGTPTEFRTRRRDGTYAVVEALADNLADAPGIRGIVVTLRDITERKRAEAQRRAIEARIQHTQKLESLGVLAGGIAHDFNNLLTGVLGHAALALTTVPRESVAHHHLQQVRLAAQRSAELTQQLLAYSGKSRVSVQPVQLSAVVEEMARLLEVSISKQCQLLCQLGPELPAFEGDPSQVRQVVMNLILNASEAIGEAPGVIRIATGAAHCDRSYLSESYVDESLQEGSYVFLEVSDTGCGMTAEIKARIFDPFFTTKFTGRGLGLAAVLGIVRSHHGALRVQSELGKGTTFRVLFPLSPTAAAVQPAAARDQQSDSNQVSATVLVIEDDRAVRNIAIAILQTAGFRVLSASDGPDGIELFRAHAQEIQAVLLDCTMPQLNGNQVMAALRSIRPEVTVVLTSGYAEAAPDAGSAETMFLQKPYAPHELVEAMQRAVKESARVV